jgi:hypothetical protein
MGTLNERAGKALAGRWREGMAVVRPGSNFRQRVTDVSEGMIYCDGDFDLSEDAVPDMSDPATRGAFLDVVREAWGEPRLYLFPERVDGGWRVYRMAGGYGQDSAEPVPDYDACLHGYATEAEALVAALEAAPR